jgi:hypothetical protein
MQILEATALDDDILVRHFLSLLESNGTPTQELQPDAKARMLEFIGDSRKRMKR